MTGPTFFVIGSEKCGTTSLCATLEQHPDVFITDPKEPHFFSNEDHYGRGLEWYRTLFEPGKTAAARGEGSVTYSYTSRAEKVVQRIREHFPDSRFIFSVRDPIQRVQSIWRQGHSLGLFDPKTPPAEWISQQRDYLETNSCYWERIRPFRETFGADAVRVVFLPDFNSDSGAVLEQLHGFLGVRPMKTASVSTANRTRGTRDLPIIRRVKDLQVARRAFHLLPVRARTRVLERFRRPVPRLDEALIRDTLDLDRVRDDNRTLFENSNKPQDYWVI